MGDVVALPPRRWQLAPGIVVEVRPVDDQRSIAVVCELGHRGWRDIWAMGATVRHHSPRFDGSQVEVPTYPSSEIAAVVDGWVAELLAAAGRPLGRVRPSPHGRPKIADVASQIHLGASDAGVT